MGVQNLALISPVDGTTNFPLRELRPVFTVIWENNGAGGGPYTVLHEWDTVATFDSGNLITDSNTGITTPLQDNGVPPSDMGGDGTTWYYQFTVTDTNDSGQATIGAAIDITWEDSIHHKRHLYTPVHVQPDFSSGGIDDPINAKVHLYVPVNVGPGWEVGGADDRLGHKSFLYAPIEVTTDVPVPYLLEIIPTVVDEGDALLVRGYGFDNAARDWGLAVRLYDNPDPLAAGATFVVLTELSFSDAVQADGLDETVVSVPTGAQSGWVIVKNEST